MNSGEFESAMGVPLTPKRLAKVILGINKKNNEDYDYCVADPSIFNKSLFGKMEDGQFGGKSIAESMMEVGLKMIRADNDRINGLGRMREVISTAPDGKPYYQIFSKCIKTINMYPALIYDEHKLDDVSTKGNDHGYDRDRYFFMSRPSKIDKKEVEPDNPIRRAYLRQQMGDFVDEVDD
jgi:hypothetical protein